MPAVVGATPSFPPAGRNVSAHRCDRETSWSAARGQREAENCCCGCITEWVRVVIVSKILPSGMRMNDIVPWESKWYTRNNRGLWCFRKAAVITVQVRVGTTNRAFLHWLTTRTDGLSVVFFRRLRARRAASSLSTAQSCTATTARGEGSVGTLRLPPWLRGSVRPTNGVSGAQAPPSFSSIETSAA